MERIESVESFTLDEQQALIPFFTNLSSPVFALKNLPEVVKGALFARYSRSTKSLRRLFLDEFFDRLEPQGLEATMGRERASVLYERIFNEYGDDSVAQLGGAHIACEGASNILTKVLEHGRLMAYLEQSTRYIPYTDKLNNKWRYFVPMELENHPLHEKYVKCLDHAFEIYAKWIDPLQSYFKDLLPKDPTVSDLVYKRTIRAKALDSLRTILPAATKSNVGIYGSGQAFESLLIRMRSIPLSEVQQYADLMLGELNKVIPDFLIRVKKPDRGILWSRYLEEKRNATSAMIDKIIENKEIQLSPDINLTEFDPEGEVKVVAAILYEFTNLPDAQLIKVAREMTKEARTDLLRSYNGNRLNRRHKPGRAFERIRYRFDIVADYGVFRDLQRHRMLTIEWQPLTTDLGYIVPKPVEETGALMDWLSVMHQAAALYESLSKGGLELIASYCVPMAYKIRFCMDMNAREAMHIIELRTSPQGHSTYRQICQMMHKLINDVAGHTAIADSMIFADHTLGEQGRLDTETTQERRREI